MHDKATLNGTDPDKTLYFNTNLLRHVYPTVAKYSFFISPAQ